MSESVKTLVNAHIQAQWATAVAGKPTLQQFTAAVQTAAERCSYHGQLSDWLRAVEQLSVIPAASPVLNQPVVSVAASVLPENAALFRQLMPWRKGPFAVGEMIIDSEWRSDLKFQRLLATGVDFRQKHILDVGCGNGYFLFRLLGEQAAFVLGLDPSWLYFAQFLALQKVLAQKQCAYLPFTVDDVPLDNFDITLSMGVLYHRRDPLQHLMQLRRTLRPKGLLILETLVTDGDEQTVMMPESRYAGMRNVWFLPAVAALRRWLERLGFKIEHISSPVATTSEEQRRTLWITGQSLADFMQPDFSKTSEGLPPPRRVIVLARHRGQ